MRTRLFIFQAERVVNGCMRRENSPERKISPLSKLGNRCYVSPNIFYNLRYVGKTSERDISWGDAQFLAEDTGLRLILGRYRIDGT